MNELIIGEPVKKKIWLSHTGLEALERCPRCFWLQYKLKIPQPEGIVSRLSNRFDRLIKNYFDIYRKQGKIPPVIEGKVEGKLVNPFKEAYFYSVDDDYGFRGNLDELLVTEEGTYTPVDHKTSSSDPRIEREMIAAYQSQLNSYAFLLESNRKKSSGIGHLIYYYPDNGDELHDGVKMAVIVKTLKTDPSTMPSRIKRAINVLENEMPKSSSTCVFCNWRATLDEI